MSANTGSPVALVTGAAVRLGAAIVRLLHEHDYNVVIHYNRSRDAADALAVELNTRRKDSAIVLQGDLADMAAVTDLGTRALAAWDRLDVLVNNASAFYPTPLEGIDEEQWNDLFASNARAPLFLAKAVAGELKQRGGSIVNMSDLYARLGLTNHSIYTMAKAANEAMTRTLARELAPEVRVNGIAPGAILWPPDEELSGEKKQAIIDKCFMQKMGDPSDIASAVLFLVKDATYITGQVLHVDGGR